MQHTYTLHHIISAAFSPREATYSEKEATYSGKEATYSSILSHFSPNSPENLRHSYIICMLHVGLMYVICMLYVCIFTCI